jgi:polyisoprenoid-binding protein YceI
MVGELQYTQKTHKELTMTRWNIDPAHSEITFKVKHLLVSTVTGHCARFNAAIEYEKDAFSDARFTFEAQVAGITTGNEQRDAHLTSADFFDGGSYLTISFVSTSVRKLNDHELNIRGDLTMRGVTKEITLDVVYNGIVAGFGGNRIAGFEARVSVNRFDFGLQWNALTEAGGVVVGNEVRIEILSEFTDATQQTKAA